MKGKRISPERSKMGKKAVYEEAASMKEEFKRGGKAKKEMGEVKGVMSKASMGRKPRKSGGGVMSSAASGTPRGKSSHY